MKKIFSGVLGFALLGVLAFTALPTSVAHAATCNCLTSDKQTYKVGDSAIFTVTGASPKSEIFWSMTQNGVSLATSLSLGQYTDSTGHYVWLMGIPFAASDIGTWSMGMTAGSTDSSISFTVAGDSSIPSSGASSVGTVPGIPMSLNSSAFFTVNSDKRHYNLGDEPIFTITGAPANTPITYEFDKNGTLDSTDVTANASTDSSGYFFGNVPGLTSTDASVWFIRFTVGSMYGFISYTTGAFPFMVSSGTVTPGTVGQSYSGTVDYTYTGSATNVEVVMFNLPQGIVPSDHYTAAGTSSTAYELSLPVTAGQFHIGLTGTPTQGGTFPIVIAISGTLADPTDAEMLTLSISGTSLPVVTTPVPTTPVTTPSLTEPVSQPDQSGLMTMPDGSSGNLLGMPTNTDTSSTTSAAPITTPGTIPAGVAAGSLVQLTGNPQVYLVEPEGLYAFSSYYGYQLYSGQGHSKITVLPGTTSSNYTMLPGLTAEGRVNVASGNGQPYVPGTLVNSNGTIYLIIKGYQVPFINYAAFTGLGYSRKNVINADLTGSGLTQTPGITSAAVSHTWGSWVNYKGTIYYCSEQGLIPAPDLATFYADQGYLGLVVPANKYDIAIIQSQASNPISPLTAGDSRVTY